MHYQKTGFPEDGELVLCTITNIQYHSVFAKLDEYGKSGMIHISEVAPGRIRNIRDFVKEGKKVVCKVLKSSEEKGHIDLSLRRVSEGLRREKMDQIKQELKAEKLLEDFAKEQKTDMKTLYPQLAPNILEHYHYLFSAFEDVVENDASLAKIGLDKKLATALETFIKDRIKPKSVQVGGELTVQTYLPAGVILIRDSLVAMQESTPNMTLHYRGAGHWGVYVEAADFKEAEQTLESSLSKFMAAFKKADGVASFKRAEKA